MGLGGPEDVVDGSGGQHLPHGLVDDLLILAAAHRHRAQEAHDEHLLQEGVCGEAGKPAPTHKHASVINTQGHVGELRGSKTRGKQEEWLSERKKKTIRYLE